MSKQSRIFFQFFVAFSEYLSFTTYKFGWFMIPLNLFSPHCDIIFVTHLRNCSTKFEKNLPLLKNYLVMSKQSRIFFKNFVAFSEYLNFSAWPRYLNLFSPHCDTYYFRYPFEELLHPRLFCVHMIWSGLFNVAHGLYKLFHSVTICGCRLRPLLCTSTSVCVNLRTRFSAKISIF